MADPLVSIIVSNWNSESFIVPCLDSIFRSAHGSIEVIVVDDASTDGGPDLAEKEFGKRPDFHLIRHEKPLGLTRVFNDGFRACRGENVVFMHSDTVVEKYWLQHLLGAMQDETVGCCGGKFLSMNDKETLLGAGHKIDYFGYPVRPEYTGRPDDGTHERAERVFDAWDACMIIRRKVLEEVGLFDEDFFYANEEIDLCWRINLAGYKIMYVPLCIVYHKSEIISKSTPLGFAYHMSKNYLQAVLKNYGAGSLAKYLPAILTLMLARIAIERIRGRPEIAKSMARGFFWNFTHLGIIMAKRTKTQKEIRKVGDSEIRKVMLPASLSRYISTVKKAR